MKGEAIVTGATMAIGAKKILSMVPAAARVGRRTTMKALFFGTIFLALMSVLPGESYAERGHGRHYAYGHLRGPWAPSYRLYYSPYYGPVYRPWGGYYYGSPVYVYPVPPRIYAPPPVVVIPDEAYAYPEPPPPEPPHAPAPPPHRPSLPSRAPAAALEPIYFDLDQSVIRHDAAKTLEKNLEWFRQNPGRMVSIQGNCDPRATSPYNLALGQRRAEATKKYLVSLGVDGTLLETKSHGKESPICGAGDESCWSKERRVDFEPMARTSMR